MCCHLIVVVLHSITKSGRYRTWRTWLDWRTCTKSRFRQVHVKFNWIHAARIEMGPFEDIPFFLRRHGPWLYRSFSQLEGTVDPQRIVFRTLLLTHFSQTFSKNEEEKTFFFYSRRFFLISTAGCLRRFSGSVYGIVRSIIGQKWVFIVQTIKIKYWVFIVRNKQLWSIYCHVAEMSGCPFLVGISALVVAFLLLFRRNEWKE